METRKRENDKSYAALPRFITPSLLRSIVPIVDSLFDTITFGYYETHLFISLSCDND